MRWIKLALPSAFERKMTYHLVSRLPPGLDWWKVCSQEHTSLSQIVFNAFAVIIQLKHKGYLKSWLYLICFSFTTGHFYICVICTKTWPIIFHFNSLLSFRWLCRLLQGYQFHFVISNPGSSITSLLLLNGGRPPSWIFESSKVYLPLRFGGPVCVTLPNFVPIGQTIEEMAIFRFLEMAAVRHLGFVLRVFRSPTKSIWWSLSLCKIWLESVQ